MARLALGEPLPAVGLAGVEPDFTTDEVSMRPVTGGYPAVEYPSESVPHALAGDGRRRGLLRRLLVALLAALLLLLLWTPAVVRAQGRAIMPAEAMAGRRVEPVSQEHGAGERSPSLGPAAGPGTTARGRPSPVILERVDTTGREAVEQVPFGGVLVQATSRPSERDSSRLDRGRAGGRDLVPRGHLVLGLVGAEAMADARGSGEAPTVFHRGEPSRVETDQWTPSAPAPSAPSPHRDDVLAAPFPVMAARLARAAIVGGLMPSTADAAGIARRYRMDDEVSLRLPMDAVVRIGDRLTPVVVGGTVAGALQVAVPTGVVEVVRVGRGTARAVVRSQFAVIADGQRVLPVVGEGAPWQGADGGSRGALEARVRWREDAGRLPSPHGYLLLDVGAGHGVIPGDRFALRRPASRGHPDGEAVAMVRVVRVDAAHSTARITALLGVVEASAPLVARRVAPSGRAASVAQSP